jgi:hypothetical protein
MTSDFQKNAVGMVWLAATIYALYRSAEHPTGRRVCVAGVFFILAGITHIGAFGVTLAYVLLFAAALFLIDPFARKRFLPLLLIGVIVLLVIFAGLVLLGVRGKATNLLSVFTSPLRLIHPSLVSSLATGSPIRLSLPAIVEMIFIDVVAIGGLAILLKSGKHESVATRTTVVAAVLSCFLFSSPFTSWELGAGRLFMMAYLPAAVVVAFLLTHLRSVTSTRAIAVVTLLITAASVVGTVGSITIPCIPEESYPELRRLEQYIEQPERTLIIARHGLEWWAGWALRTHVSQEFGVQPTAWDRYDKVMFLQQTAGHAPFGPQGRGGPRFREVRLPEQAEILFDGAYFRLAVSDHPPDFYPLSRPKAP